MGRAPQVGKEKARPPKRPGLMRCIGPPGARDALLRSPILPAAAPVVEEKMPTVQRQTIPGAEANAIEADISIGRK
jgi:hypothetical protein